MIYFVINLFRAQGYQPTIRRCALQPGRPPRMRPSSRACRRPDTRDRGVEVAPAGRGGDVDGAVAVEPDRSQLRLPAPGSNAQAISKTGEAARSHVPMASASGIAPRRARSLRSRAGAGADIARPRAACAPASRAQRQGRPKLLRMPGGGHTCGWCSEEVGLGDEVDCGVGRLARIIAPRRVHCDVCAWRVSCVWSGVCCGGARVDLAWRLGEEGGTRAEIAPGTEAETAPRAEGRRPPVRRTSPERRRRVVMRWSEGAA